jgi:membrane-associated progesterone receptor component
MYKKDSSQFIYDSLINEIYFIIDTLHDTPCIFKRNSLLDLLEYKISSLIKLTDFDTKTRVSIINDITNVRPAQEPQMNISLEQLSKYNGKNGNPAYVAVEGIVYDVTDNAAWGAATHFGLIAGKDLTEQYKSCHAGQQILTNLKRIGKII